MPIHLLTYDIVNVDLIKISQECFVEPSESRPRKRSLTSVTLGWIAERIARADRIKKAVDEGNYKTNPEEIASSIIGKEPKN